MGEDLRDFIVGVVWLFGSNAFIWTVLCLSQGWSLNPFE